MMLVIVLALVVIVMALPSIVYAAGQFYSLYTKQGPYIVDSAKKICSLGDMSVDSLVGAVEKTSNKDERIQRIIDLYRTTGEITECDIKQLSDILDSDERKRLNLPDVVCNALACASK